MTAHKNRPLGRCRLPGALAVFCIGFSSIANADDGVRVYPAAPGEPLSSQYTVDADGQAVPVYLATVLAMSPEQRQRSDLQHFADGDLGQTSFASLDLRGETRITVTSPQPIASAKVLPSSSGIVPRVSGHSATFTLSKPGQFVLEINGDWVHSLQVFANPWESDAPNPNDPDVIYYGPGIHRVASVKVGSGKTVYLAAEAVVYGTTEAGSTPGPIFDLKGDHIVLRGRGIIDGSLCPHGARSMVAAEGRDIAIRDVVLRDSGSWTVPLTGSDRVEVRNIKVFGYRGNSDGIDVNGSRDVEVGDSYLRTGDDLVVIKSQIPGKGDSRNITVERCVLWNELAHALSLGAEIRKPIDHVRFSDCDVIHDKGREWTLRVYHCDAALVSDVAFENIRVEESRRLISLWIGAAMWSNDPDRGHIDGVAFRNISSPLPERGQPYADLQGADADHAIHHVTFDRVSVGGRPLRREDLRQNGFSDGITLAPWAGLFSP